MAWISLWCAAFIAAKAGSYADLSNVCKGMLKLRRISSTEGSGLGRGMQAGLRFYEDDWIMFVELLRCRPFLVG